MLDSLRPTATGLDNMPAWFMRLAAPVLCGRVADLINVSLMTTTVPRHQWKQARIQPVPNVSSPHQASHYRPISITRGSYSSDGTDRRPALRLPRSDVATADTTVP